MRVHIDETGGDDLIFRVIDLGTVRTKIFSDLADHAVLDEDITDFISLCGGVDHPTALEEQCTHQAFPPISTKVKSAMRMATPFFTSS